MIEKAFLFAYEKHKGVRKGSTIPYIVHPLDVASILMKEGASEEVVSAGLLHDVLEDTDTNPHELKEGFGEEVAQLVKGASEPEEYWNQSKEEKRKSWKKRKEHTIEYIKTADKKIKILICADKLSNIRDTKNGLLLGKVDWAKFNAPQEEQKWYYEALLESLKDIKDTDLWKMFEINVKEVFNDKSNNL